MDVIYHLKK